MDERHRLDPLESERYARLVAAFREAIKAEGFIKPDEIKAMISAGMKEYLRDPQTLAERKAVFSAAIKDMADESAKAFGWFSFKWLGTIALLFLLLVGARLKGWV